MTLSPSVLWRATRSYSLPASVVPVLLGTVLAARGYETPPHFNALNFAIVLLGGVLAHFGANVLNDYFDFMKGVDTRPEHGSGVITSGDMTPPQALGFALALLFGAALCGLVLLPAHGAVVVPLTLIGLACAVLYSGFLKRFALGDLLIVLAFGLGLTLGAYGVQAGELPKHAAVFVGLCSVPVCLLVDAILHANNLRDAPDDRAAHVRTMATLLGPRLGSAFQQFLLFGPLIFVAAGILLRFLPVWSLATFAAIPLLVRAAKSGSVPGTAQTHLVFGVLYTASFLLKPVFI